MSSSLPHPTTTRRRIPLPLLLLCTIMLWCHVAIAQSSSLTSSARPMSSATSTSSGAADAGLEATPSLTIFDVPTVTACSNYRLTWDLNGEDPSNQQITLQVININVPQSIPAASASSSSSSIASRAASSSVAVASTSRAASSSAAAPTSSSRAAIATSASASAARRDLVARANINQTIVIQAANVGYTWNVNVPQGRYYLYGHVRDQFGTMAHTDLFTVLEGSNTSCLQSSNSQVSSTPKTSPTSSATVGAADSGSGSSGSGGIPAGAIAGIVVGALAVIALIAGFFLWRRRRARRAQLYTGGEKPDLGSDTSHGPRAVALGSLNTTGSMASDAEKDAQRSFGSDSGHGHQSPVLLTGGGQRTPPAHSDPFYTTPSTPSDEAYGGYDESYDSRRASEVPAGAVGAQTPRSRSLSQPAEGQTSPLQSPGSAAPSPGTVVRTGSKRRKPVPSLGAELRGQLRDEDRHMRGSGGVPPLPGSGSSGEVTPKQSFQIMPDPPINSER